jgi:hypothetical protein
MTVSNDACALIVQAVACTAAVILRQEESAATSRVGTTAVVRVRRSVHDVYRCLGSSYFRQEYRMSYGSFWKLHKKLATGINHARLELRRYVPSGMRRGGNFKLPPIRNGRITTSVHLACVLRYFAGGSTYDLVSTYGIS